jgi:hypothetical protein
LGIVVTTDPSSATTVCLGGSVAGVAGAGEGFAGEGSGVAVTSVAAAGSCTAVGGRTTLVGGRGAWAADNDGRLTSTKQATRDAGFVMTRLPSLNPFNDSVLLRTIGVRWRTNLDRAVLKRESVIGEPIIRVDISRVVRL